MKNWNPASISTHCSNPKPVSGAGLAYYWDPASIRGGCYRATGWCSLSLYIYSHPCLHWLHGVFVMWLGVCYKDVNKTKSAVESHHSWW